MVDKNNGIVAYPFYLHLKIKCSAKALAMCYVINEEHCTKFHLSTVLTRHFGDPEIFNKPLVVLMGPWSGGKSSTLNYLLGTEYTKNAFKAGILFNG